MSKTVLHGYWRSSATYRVRIALALKGVSFDLVSHDLRTGAQRDPIYLTIAPHGLVPALEQDGQVLIESPAILEWVEQRWPSPPLIPADPYQAATVRAMAALVGCDIHPLNNLRVLTALRQDFDASDEQVAAWIRRWTNEGFTALEQLVSIHGGKFAFGETPTLADCYVVPQLYNAQRFDVDLRPYPCLASAGAAASALPAFAAAHPDAQPDAG